MTRETNDIRKLGSIYGFRGGSFAGNVYDPRFLCPTLNTAQGGHRTPLILVRKVRK